MFASLRFLVNYFFLLKMHLSTQKKINPPTRLAIPVFTNPLSGRNDIADFKRETDSKKPVSGVMRSCLFDAEFLDNFVNAMSDCFSATGGTAAHMRPIYAYTTRTRSKTANIWTAQTMIKWTIFRYSTGQKKVM